MKRVIFLGQAMARSKKDPHDWPSLNSWLYSIDITDGQIKKNFFYSALVDYFPGAKNGSHRVPSKQEITKERSRLKNTINSFDPDIVVPIGRLSISYCLRTKKLSLRDYIGKTFISNPYRLLTKEVLIIPFPHPSGASTWHRKLKNKKLVKMALKTLKENLAIKGSLLKG